ncbi:MAG: putative sulfate exporter family transporter [Aquabacterium sp.]|nr:MAG: putative sulfate exporter family transporter [Aquabacterium sp.]
MRAHRPAGAALPFLRRPRPRHLPAGLPGGTGRARRGPVRGRDVSQAALAWPRSGWQQRAATARGALLPATIAVAASFVADHHGGPVLLYALLMGMVLNFLHEQPHVQQAAQVCSSRVLRVGVALLGARITWDQCAHLGSHTVLLLMACVTLALLAGAALGRLLRWPLHEAVVAGGAVAICGASAALALSEAMPRHRLRPQVVLYIVVCVTCLSTTAMVVYPPLLQAMGIVDARAGVFLGASIHDVAQVIGAGYHMGQAAGDTASVTKMMRVAMLVPAVLIVGWAFRERADADAQVPASARPWFLLGFALLVTLNSVGALPPALRVLLVTASQFCILVAVAALGLRTSLQQLGKLGWRLPVLLVVDSLLLAVVARVGLPG